MIFQSGNNFALITIYIIISYFSHKFEQRSIFEASLGLKQNKSAMKQQSKILKKLKIKVVSKI